MTAVAGMIIFNLSKGNSMNEKSIELPLLLVAFRGLILRSILAYALLMLPWSASYAEQEAVKSNNFEGVDVIIREIQTAAGNGSVGLDTLKGRKWDIRYVGKVQSNQVITLEAEPRWAFLIERLDGMNQRVTLVDPSALLSSIGNLKKISFIEKIQLVTETDTSGIGLTSCQVTTQFLATGTRKPIPIGAMDSNSVVLSISDPEIVSFLRYDGADKEIAVFNRKEGVSQDVFVTLKLLDKEVGWVEYKSPPLANCAGSASSSRSSSTIIQRSQPSSQPVSKPNTNVASNSKSGALFGLHMGVGGAFVRSTQPASDIVPTRIDAFSLGGGVQFGYRFSQYISSQLYLSVLTNFQFSNGGPSLHIVATPSISVYLSRFSLMVGPSIGGFLKHSIGQQSIDSRTGKVSTMWESGSGLSYGLLSGLCVGLDRDSSINLCASGAVLWYSVETATSAVDNGINGFILLLPTYQW